MRLDSSSTAASLLNPTAALPLRVRQRGGEGHPGTSWLRLPGNAAPAGLLARSEHEPSPSRPVPPPPQPPAEWAATTSFLTLLARSPVPPPSWWKTHAQFRASFETHTDSTCYAIGGNVEQGSGSPSAISLQLTLAGYGLCQVPGAEPEAMGPGKAFFAGESIGVRHCLPEKSPGWTFVRVEIFHPYLQPRITSQVRDSGPLIELRPGDALTASLLRLVRGDLAKDFRDRYEAELALFNFALACERCVGQAANGARETERMMDDVRALVLARLPAAVEVSFLAEKFGMSRSYFSHLFRAQTGITPAHFATEVRIQQVEQMLLDTCEPLKSIAAACGFANANHLCKVFRRFRHHTPSAFRQSLGH